jgi:putative peptide zinc metalloprotease protein
MAERLTLRDDLAVTEKDSDGDRCFLVTDPRNNQTYEFGEQEWFLLQCMDGRSGPEELTGRFRSRYAAELNQEDLESFVSMITQWGLVDGANDTLTAGPDGAAPYDDLIEIPKPDAAAMLARRAKFRPGPPGLDAEVEEASWMSWVWFDPTRLMLSLGRLYAALRWSRYLLPFLGFIALAIIYNNVQEFLLDFQRFRRPLSIFQILLFSMLTVNLVVQLGRGAAARAAGVGVPEFGIKMVLGILPRFAVRTGGLSHLSREAQLSVYASPLLIRIGMFSLAAILWSMSRATGTVLPSLFLMLLTVSAFSFFVAANPLLRSDGYFVLATLLEMPKLRQKANLALFGKSGSELTDRFLMEDNRFALRAYALASIIFIFIFLGAGMIIAARWLELNYQGTGVALYLLLAGLLFRRFQKRYVEKRTEMREKRSRFEATVSAKETSPRAGDRGQRPAKKRRPTRRSRRKTSGVGRKLFRYGLLILFLIALFLPYPYETGGVVRVLPNEQNEIYAETEGNIRAVYIKSGEFVPAGTVVASLASFDQEKAIATTRSAILESQARLEQLLSTPTKEEIALAESRLRTAETQFQYSTESAKRFERLYKEGNVSLEDYQDEQKQMEVDRQQVEEARANLDKVRAGPHPKEIEAIRYEIERLQERLKFEENDLLRTRLTMPMDGRVVTANLDHMVGQYLDEGDHFATVENDRTVRIEIQVPESDIGDVVVGADARFKVWAYSDRIFTGQVSEVAPVATEETYGQVVAVTVVVPNEDGALKSGMTGFGKVEGGTKLVVVAFTRMLTRFVTIEIWSWIP